MSILKRIFSSNLDMAESMVEEAKLELRASEMAIETAKNKLEASLRTYTAEIYDCKVKRAEAKGHLAYLQESLKLNIIQEDEETHKEEIQEQKTIISTLTKVQQGLEKDEKQLESEAGRLDKEFN